MKKLLSFGKDIEIQFQLYSDHGDVLTNKVLQKN